MVSPLLILKEEGIRQPQFGRCIFLPIEIHPEDPWACFQPVSCNSWGWPARTEVQLFSDDISLWMASVPMLITSNFNILRSTANGLWQSPVWKTMVAQRGVWCGMVVKNMRSRIRLTCIWISVLPLLSATLNNSFAFPKSVFPGHDKTYKGGEYLWHRVAILSTMTVTGS